MDVTYGLLSTLVKTRSIQRVLAPIASQISLLIILNESQDGSHMHLGQMVPCAKVVMTASHKLALVAKQQAQASTDQDLKAQTISACEVLELSSSNLYIASERLEASNSIKEARSRLVQSSKDVLQGTMKVLLVADDAQIRRLITAMHIVTEKLSLVTTATNKQDLVDRFKEFADALTVMTSLADKRQKDLINSRQRERIITSLNILHTSISSLSIALQNSVKYRHNLQAMMGTTYVVTEIQSAMGEIMDAIQNKDNEISDANLEEPGLFVASIDKALDCLSEERRDDLHIDLEMWIEEAVRHSMTVAHLSYDSHRDLIIGTCQRVIQVKGSLVQMHRSFINNSDTLQIREEYYDACETLIDEFCELEKNVNVTLLHLVVEHFKETTQPLERLVEQAIQPSKCSRQGIDYRGKFEDHAEKMCQVAVLLAASCTDARRVQVIRTSVKRLEHLDPDIVPAVLALTQTPHDKAITRHLKLLMKDWTLQLSNLLQVIDQMTDPKMFMFVSERLMEDDINTCNGSILIADQQGFTLMLQSIIGRSRRVAQVAERIVDAHNDPLFRNGLMVFVQKLKKVITAVRLAGEDIGSSFTSKPHHAVLHKRFDQLQEAMSKMKKGLSAANHPHVLSPLRYQARVQTPTSVHKSSSADVPLKTADTRLAASKPTKPSTHCHDKYTTLTSVPRLDLPLTEETIELQTATSLKTQMGKSTSLGNMKHNTYAWNLSSDLVSWSTKGERERVNGLCSDMLGWTNHIADVSQSVLAHCTDAAKKKEIEATSSKVDELTPELIESAKYVLHGDFSHLNTFQTQANQWATMIEKIRVYVDIMVDSWKCLADKVTSATRTQKTDLVQHQLQTIQGHYESVNNLVTITEAFKLDSNFKQMDKLESLSAERNDLENVTVTFKTTAEMISKQGFADQLSQIEQLGREWSVKVYSLLCTMEGLCDQLLQSGLDRKIWRGLSAQDGLLEVLQSETSKIKDLMKSACYGDEDKMALYKDMMYDMTHCIEDLKGALMRRKTSQTSMANSHKYSTLVLGLYRGIWISKALQCLDIARQQTSLYAASIDVIIDKVFSLKLATDDDHSAQSEELQSMLASFSDKVASLRKKVLSGIQLSTELEKRSVIRQCLDKLNLLAPQIVAVIKTLAEDSSCSCHGDVLWYRLMWCCRIHHLLACLREMADIKHSLLPEIIALLEPADYSPEYDDICERLSSVSIKNASNITTIPSSQHNVPLSAKSCDSQKARSHGDGSESHDLKNEAKSKNNKFSESKNSKSAKTFSEVPTNKLSVSAKSMNKMLLMADDTAGCGDKLELFEPSVVDLEAIDEQIILHSR